MNRSFLANILYYPGPGSYKAALKIVDIIRNEKNIYPQNLVNEVDINAIRAESLHQRAFNAPVDKINLSVNFYSNKSPVLGVMGEYLAYSTHENYELTLLFMKTYFDLIINYCEYTEIHYQLWLEGEYERLFRSYSSSIERAGRSVRLALSNEAASELLVKVKNGLLDDSSRPLIKMIEYAQGANPLVRNGYKSSLQKITFQRVSEEASATLLEESEGGDYDSSQLTVDVPIPSYVNTKTDLLRSINKINARANQQNRLNQLSVNHKNVLRPSVWVRVDEIILSNRFDLSARRLICTVLLTGRSAEFCMDNYNNIHKVNGYLVLNLNFPESKSKKFPTIPVENALKIAIPLRYLAIFAGQPAVLEGSACVAGKKILKLYAKKFDISFYKIQQLFMYLSANIAGKTVSSAMFPFPIPNFKTQLHYSIMQAEALLKVYRQVWDEFEAGLSNPLGLPSDNHLLNNDSSCVGSDSFPKLGSILKSVSLQDEKNKLALRKFLAYSGLVGSRAVYDQSILVSTRMANYQIGLINDKKRQGSQFTRLAVIASGEIFNLIGHSNSTGGLADLKFQYLSDSQKYTLLSPKVFSLKNKIFFPMNTARKYRRSFLLAQGLSEEVIDLLNGHFSVGQVAISKTSSLSISQCVNEAKNALKLFYDWFSEVCDEGSL